MDYCAAKPKQWLWHESIYYSWQQERITAAKAMILCACTPAEWVNQENWIKKEMVR